MDVPPPAPPRADDTASGAASSDGPGSRPARLVREPDDRKVAGVCAALADRLGLDVSLVRLGAVVLTIFTPVGLVAYLVAWAVVPLRGPHEPRVVAPAADLTSLRRVPLWVLVAAGVALVVYVSDGSWWFWWPDGPVLAVALVAIGVWLLVRADDDPGGGVDDPKSAPSNTLGVTGTTLNAGSPETVGTVRGAGPSGEVSPPVLPGGSGAGTLTTGTQDTGSEPRSHVASAVFALLLIGGGLAWLLHVLDVATLSVDEGLAAGLVVMGLGLIVAAWWGRAWSLAVLGLLAVPVLAFVEVVDVPFDAGMGDRRVVADTRSELTRSHELFAGTLTLDLRPTALPSAGTTSVDAAVGVGRLRVIVPRDADVDVDARVEAGSITGDLAPSPDEGGVDLHETFGAPGRGAGPDLRLDLRVGIGELEVDRA